MRKIFVAAAILIATFAFSTSTKAVYYDYRDGIFDDAAWLNENTLSTSSNWSKVTALFDNNLTTKTSSGYVAKIRFKNPVFANAFYIKLSGNSSGTFSLLNSSGEKDVTFSKADFGIDDFPDGAYHRMGNGRNRPIFGVEINTASVLEFELFVAEPVEPVKSVKVVPGDTTATVTYQIPSDPKQKYLSQMVYVLNGKEVERLMLDTKKAPAQKVLNNLKPSTTYTLVIKSYFYDGAGVSYDSQPITFTTEKDITPPGNVKNLTSTLSGDNAVLKWTNPTDSDFSHVKIFRNNKLISEKRNGTSFTDTSADVGDNVYKVLSVDTSENESPGVTTTINMPPVDVSNLTAKATDFNAVDLSWTNTTRESFQTVTIYRKKEGKARLLNFLNDGYDVLFETNGTTFKDRTVDVGTAYTYKVTTTSNNVESDGVTVNVSTPSLALSGATGTKNQEEFIYTWTSPTVGKVRIEVGNKNYKTVPAADKKIIVPAAEMVYDVFGNPLVKMYALTNDEKLKSEAWIPPNASGGSNMIGKLPKDVSPSNLLKVAMLLFAAIAAFVLLALAFKVVPRLIELIKMRISERND